MRKIVVNDKTYLYRISKGNTVIRCDGKTKIIDHSKLTGRSWYDIERGTWKRYFHIKPKEVADYIIKYWNE